MERVNVTCHDIDELAGLYVLDALEPAEMASVSAHLQECPDPHPLFAELAAGTIGLLATVERLDTPLAMKDRVMAAVAVIPQGPRPRACRHGSRGAATDDGAVTRADTRADTATCDGAAACDGAAPALDGTAAARDGSTAGSHLLAAPGGDTGCRRR